VARRADLEAVQPYPGVVRSRILSTLGAGVVVAIAVAAPVGAQEEPPPDPTGRQRLVPVPVGCDAPPLPDIVFVGTVSDIAVPAGQPTTAEFQTARYEVQQVRAGTPDSFVFNGFIDVRYGVDAKYLEVGGRYLIGASVDSSLGVLASKVRASEPLFGGDEVIGAAERDVTCPVIEDPVRTLTVDGTGVESGVLTPLSGATPRVLRSFLLPAAVALAVVFGLAALRWAVTGAGTGVGAVVRTARQTREVRSATRARDPRWE